MAKHLTERREEFQRALRSWYHQHARKLPWRESPSLYKTVVSEFMLQQTQVKTVLPYFARWLAALPDFATLAAAPEATVLKLWEGLGYYSRVRNLHRLAREIATRAAPPTTSREWQELPGVGPYTAAAITSISFAAPAACVDGNVVRILARLTADATAYRDAATAAKAFAPLAHALLPPQGSGDHNQAMMELGATVCFRHNPLCLTCPVRPFCRAQTSGQPEDFPQLAARAMERRRVTRLWCARPDALLCHRTPADARRLANLHELPSTDQIGLAEEKSQRGPLLAQKRRGITRFQITESIHHLPVSALPRKLPPDLFWVEWDQLAVITFSGPHRRWVEELLVKHGCLKEGLPPLPNSAGSNNFLAKRPTATDWHGPATRGPIAPHSVQTKVPPAAACQLPVRPTTPQPALSPTTYAAAIAAAATPR